MDERPEIAYMVLLRSSDGCVCHEFPGRRERGARFLATHYATNVDVGEI